MAAAAALKARQLLEQRMWAEAEVAASWYPNQFVEDSDGYQLREGGGDAIDDVNFEGATYWDYEQQDDFNWSGESWKDDPKRHVRDFSIAMMHQSGEEDITQKGGSSMPNQQYNGGGGSSGSSAPVRKTVDLAKKFAQRKPDLPVTTLMLRNLPNNTTRFKLMMFLDESGFRFAYDFVYLPLDSATHTCLAYAFVNFQDATTADQFTKQLSGVLMPPDRKRSLQISPAHIQGLEANLEHLVSSAVLTGDPALRPWFRQDPKQQSENQQWMQNSNDLPHAEDPVPSTRKARSRNHFEQWREKTLATAKQVAESMEMEGSSSSSTAVVDRSSSACDFVAEEQVGHRGNLPRLRSLGSSGAFSQRLSGLVSRLNASTKQKELEDARSPERQQSRLESLRTQIEAVDSTIICGSRKAVEPKIDFEKSFALMEALLRKSLPSPMPTLAVLSRSFLHHYTKVMRVLGDDDNASAAQANGLPITLPFQSPAKSATPAISRERKSNFAAATETSIATFERKDAHVVESNDSIATAIAEAAAAAKRRTIARIASEPRFASEARIATEQQSKVANPWPSSYGLPVDAHAYSLTLPSSLLVKPSGAASMETPESFMNSQAFSSLASSWWDEQSTSASAESGFMNSQAAPFTPGLAAWLPKSGSMVEHAGGNKSGDFHESTDLEDTFLLTQLACPSIAPVDAPPPMPELPLITRPISVVPTAVPQASEETLGAVIEAKPLVIQETLGAVIEAKPLGIQEWPALGAPKSKGVPKTSHDQVGKRRAPSRPKAKAPRRSLEPASTASPSWLVPLLGAGPPADNAEQEKIETMKTPYEAENTSLVEEDAPVYGRPELLAARAWLRKTSPPRTAAASGSSLGSTLLPTVIANTDLPPSLYSVVSRRVASTSRSAANRWRSD